MKLNKEQVGGKKKPLFFRTASFSVLLEVRVAAREKHFTLFFPISLCPHLSSPGKGRIKTERRDEKQLEITRMKLSDCTCKTRLQTLVSSSSPVWDNKTHTQKTELGYVPANPLITFLTFPTLKTGSPPSFFWFSGTKIAANMSVFYFFQKNCL